MFAEPSCTSISLLVYLVTLLVRKKSMSKVK